MNKFGWPCFVNLDRPLSFGRRTSSKKKKLIAFLLLSIEWNRMSIRFGVKTFNLVHKKDSDSMEKRKKIWKQVHVQGIWCTAHTDYVHVVWIFLKFSFRSIVIQVCRHSQGQWKGGLVFSFNSKVYFYMMTPPPLYSTLWWPSRKSSQSDECVGSRPMDWHLYKASPRPHKLPRM